MALEVVIPYAPRLVQREIHKNLDSHRFSVIVAHRRMGKTTSVINQLVKKALLNKTDNARYAYVAPFFSQAKDIAWTMLNHYTKNIPNTKRNVSELWVEFPNGSRITLYGSDNPDRMRGIGLDGCVIDEVAQCKPELWGEVVRPALMDKKGFCVFIGTPKGIDKFYELYHEACKSKDWYAASFPVTETSVIPEDELVLARKTMTDNEFRREMLCDFTASVDDLFITIGTIDAATERELRDDEWKFSPLVLSIDVARFGDDSSVITVRQGLKIREIARFGDMDLMTLADHSAKYIQNYKPDAVFVDVVGLGAGLVDRLRSLGYDVIEVNGASSPSDKKYYNKRAECWGNMREWLKYGSIPRDNGLRVDLASPKYVFKMEKLLLESKDDMKKRGLKSPDAADSLAISFSVPLAGVSAHYDRQDASTYEFSIRRYHDTVNPYTGY